MRYSKQRETVYGVLCNTKSHPDVSSIYSEAKKVLPSIGLGTVYRNLEELCSMNCVRRICAEGFAERFDANMICHAHFVCRSCGRIFDVESPLTESECVWGTVEKSDTMFYGVCNDCKKSSEKKN